MPLKTWTEALDDARVGDNLIIYAEDGSIEYILKLIVREKREDTNDD